MPTLIARKPYQMLVATLDYESFFRAVMATASSSIVIVDDRLAVLAVNQNFLEKSQTGLSSTLGRRLHEIFPAAVQDAVLDRQLRKIIAGGRTLRRQQMTCRAPSAAPQIYSYSVCPLQLQRGARAAMLVMDDVTDIVRLGEEAQRMQARFASVAENAGELVKETEMRQGEKLAALGMVIGGIAHEIRNPLGVSSAAAQLMRETMTAPALLEECIDKVIAGIDRASLVVESLLRFARPGPITQTTKVDVFDMLNNALTLASGDAAAGTTVDWKPPCMPAPLYADGVQNLLELVIVNLLLNAFQAMPNGGRLTIAVWRDGAEAVIEIRDTGPGIPEAHLAKIFDPFFTTRSDSRRSGLGLSVSHSIVRQHGGSLTVRTSPSEGATFVVRIPGARDKSAAAGAADVS